MGGSEGVGTRLRKWAWKPHLRLPIVAKPPQVKSQKQKGVGQGAFSQKISVIRGTGIVVKLPGCLWFPGLP